MGWGVTFVPSFDVLDALVMNPPLVEILLQRLIIFHHKQSNLSLVGLELWSGHLHSLAERWHLDGLIDHNQHRLPWRSLRIVHAIVEYQEVSEVEVTELSQQPL